MEEELAVAYRNAPQKVKAGRVLMMIGCILFFIGAFIDIGAFILTFVVPEVRETMDWSNVPDVIRTFFSPVLGVFLIFAGIGGISFVRDKGPFKRMATLTAIIMLVFFVIDTILVVRNFVHNLIDGTGSMSWINFIVGLIDIQISGGLYFIGWFMLKDFVGD